ncbi:MAG: hypothetical protein WAX80_03650, partial [Minisyncoccia bacterium]
SEDVPNRKYILVWEMGQRPQIRNFIFLDHAFYMPLLLFWNDLSHAGTRKSESDLYIPPWREPLRKPRSGFCLKFKGQLDNKFDRLWIIVWMMCIKRHKFKRREE